MMSKSIYIFQKIRISNRLDGHNVVVFFYKSQELADEYVGSKISAWTNKMCSSVLSVNISYRVCCLICVYNVYSKKNSIYCKING